MKHIVTVPHTKGECLKALDEFSDADLLDQCEFGCDDGDHTAYLFVEADHRAAALAKLPEHMQHNAKAVAIKKISREELKTMHISPDLLPGELPVH